jgi:hypothetical protein
MLEICNAKIVLSVQILDVVVAGYISFQPNFAIPEIVFAM